MKTFNKSVLALALSSLMLVTGCSDGDDGKDGAPGEPGAPGIPGTPGEPGGLPPVSEAAETNVSIIGYEMGDGTISFEFDVTSEDGYPVTTLNQVYVKVAIDQEGGTGTPRNGGTSYYSDLNNKWTGEPLMTDGATLEQPEDGRYIFTTPVNVAADSDPHIVLRAGGDVLPYTPYMVVRTSEMFAKTTEDAACMACHVDYAKSNGKHAGYVGVYSNLIEDKAGEVAFVDGCMACHNQVAEVEDGEYGEGGYATNTMQLIGHVKHQKFEAAFDVTNCESCHTAPIMSSDLAGRGCSDCHGGTSAVMNTMAAADFDARELHKRVADRKAFSEMHELTAVMNKIADPTEGDGEYDYCIKVTADEGVDLEAGYADGDGEMYLSTYLHSYDPVKKLYINRALDYYKAAKEVSFDDGANVMDICWLEAEPLNVADGYEVSGSVRLAWHFEDESIMKYAHTDEVRNILPENGCTSCHQAGHGLGNLFQSMNEDGTANMKDHAHYGGLDDGGTGCIACHSPGMTRGVSYSFGPMIHDFHFGATAAERTVYQESQGLTNSTEVLKGSNCAGCHDGTVDLYDVPTNVLMNKSGFGASPISANCVACHSTDAAKAHMETQGGFFDGANDSTIEAAESCAVCHAEGKAYGVDIMHSGDE